MSSQLDLTTERCEELINLLTVGMVNIKSDERFDVPCTSATRSYHRTE